VRITIALHLKSQKRRVELRSLKACRDSSAEIRRGPGKSFLSLFHDKQ